MYQTNVDSFTFVDTDFRGLWKTCTLWIFDFVVMLKSAQKPIENVYLVEH